MQVSKVETRSAAEEGTAQFHFEGLARMRSHNMYREAYNKIAGHRLPAPANTNNRIASWGDLSAQKVFIG